MLHVFPKAVKFAFQVLAFVIVAVAENIYPFSVSHIVPKVTFVVVSVKPILFASPTSLPVFPLPDVYGYGLIVLKAKIGIQQFRIWILKLRAIVLEYLTFAQSREDTEDLLR